MFVKVDKDWKSYKMRVEFMSEAVAIAVFLGRLKAIADEKICRPLGCWYEKDPDSPGTHVESNQFKDIYDPWGGAEMEFLSPLSIEELKEKLNELCVLGSRDEYPDTDRLYYGCEPTKAIRTINYSHLFTGDDFGDY